MKNLTLFFWLIIFPSTYLCAQYELDGNFLLNFDNDYGIIHLSIDTISNPDNIWQIGTPQKTVFENPNSSPNVIVTDTKYAYPTNDSSSFIITNTTIGGGFVGAHTATLGGRYYVNSDTLSDYGKIEFSPDNGNTWIDLINDTVIVDTAYNWKWYWAYDKPILTGNSYEWKSFYVNLAELGPFYEIQFGDTVLYKFSFVSDSIQTNKDGLMFDDLYFEDIYENIEEIGYKSFNSICFPNPSNSQLIIKFENSNMLFFDIAIFNITGEQVFNKQNINTNSLELNIENLKSGFYYYKLINFKNKIYSTGEFIKE